MSFDHLVPIICAESKLDYFGLWEIISSIENINSNISDNLLKIETLKLVKSLLSAGIIAVDLMEDGAYFPWIDQNWISVVKRIDSEWTKLGRNPSIGDIVWFFME